MSNSGIDFASRIEVSDRLIDASKSVLRILQGNPTEETEISLATQMVEIRDTLIHMRDVIGLDLGHDIQVDGSSVPAFGNFVDGFHSIATTCMAIQVYRNNDVDWTEARAASEQLRSGIQWLLLFQAFAHASQTDLSVLTARHQLQLARDRRRINSPPKETDADDLSTTDQETITASELAEIFTASAKVIRTRIKNMVPKTQNGTSGRNYRFKRCDAIRACDDLFSRRNPLNDTDR